MPLSPCVWQSEFAHRRLARALGSGETAPSMHRAEILVFSLQHHRPTYHKQFAEGSLSNQTGRRLRGSCEARQITGTVLEGAAWWLWGLLAA